MPRNWQESMQDVAPYLGLGAQMAATMVFFVAVGYMADQWLETEPWFLLSMAILGVVSVFLHLFRMASQLSSKRKKR